jgi:amino acid transporter
VLSLIAMMLIGNFQRAVYVVAVALVVALLGLGLAVSAMREAKRTGTRRPRAAIASAVLSGLGALLSGSALVVLLVFWSQYMQYGNCLNGASTIAARNACDQQFKNSVSDRIAILGHR